MLKFSLTADLFEFDSNGYHQALMDYLEKEMMNAGRKFAEAALARIPIRTGFAAGSFLPLQELLGIQARLNPIANFIRKSLGLRTHVPRKLVQGEYYKGILKTPESGSQFGTPSNQIFTRDGDIIRFNFAVDITYFDINDLTSGHAPTAPWGAFAAGQEAFLNYIASVLDKSPSLRYYLRIVHKQL